MKAFNEESFKGRVYAHINKENGMAYVGATTADKPEHRWGKDGNRYAGQFGDAIKEFGWDTFDHIIYEEVFTSPEDLNAAEANLVDLYDSIDNGYNIMRPGSVNYRALSEGLSKSAHNKKAVAMIHLETMDIEIFESYHEAGRWLHENVAPQVTPQRLSKKVYDIITPGVNRKSAYGYSFIDLSKIKFKKSQENK